MYPLLEEIWIEIFSYLDPYSRQNIVSLVCNDWLDIIRNDCRHLKIKRIVHYAEINSMLRNNWPKLKVSIYVIFSRIHILTRFLDILSIPGLFSAHTFGQ